jgi:hypothetical protein
MAYCRRDRVIHVLLRNYLVHNIFAHPAMEILHRTGWHGLADYVHDRTVPEEDRTLQSPREAVPRIDPTDLPNMLAGNGHWRDYVT